MKETAVEVKGFRKTYGDFVAVDGISFSVRQGEIFGLLGPNGAGKTTTLESLEGLRAPDGGVLRVASVDPTRDPRKLRNVIGVQLQSGGLPANITPIEAMDFFCAYHSVSPRYDLLERLGLGEKRHTQYEELSTGQQRRLSLALAVAHEPRVLFLDEPTAGLDVGSRRELHKLMREHREQGAAIFRSYKISGIPAASIVIIPALTTVLHLTVVALIITVTAPILFDAPLPVAWLSYALVFLAFASASAGLGVLIGVVAPSSRVTVMLSQVVFLPSMLLGGLMLPYSMLPESVSWAARLMPATYAMNALNGLAMGLKADFGPWASVLVLGAGAVLAFALAITLFNWDERNSTRRGHPALGLLALVPYVTGLLLL